LALKAPVDCDPLVGMFPDQPPDAEHVVALVLDQDSVALAPLLIELGLAEIVTVGAGELTDTVADWTALPAVPVHVRV
jgi:hypothetical protein